MEKEVELDYPTPFTQVMPQFKLKEQIYWVLEYSALDDNIEIYEFKSSQTDESLVYEEISEGLHNYSNVIILNKEKAKNLLKAVEKLKGI